MGAKPENQTPSLSKSERKIKMNEVITNPTAKDIDDACKKFAGDINEPDPALNLLFDKYPKNIDFDHVLLKVVALNALYSTMIRVNSKLTPTVYDVARHIVDRNIDADLDEGSESLVDRIANTEQIAKSLGKEKQYNYAFATKYCSFHRPNFYPIHDSRVNEYLWHLRNLGKLSQFKRMDLWAYSKFKKIVDEFRERYNLQEFTYKQVDAFLYYEGGKLIGQKESTFGSTPTVTR
jgi:hypothetical protein